MKLKLSDKIKLELMKYFRFERDYKLVCTEGIHLADVNAYNGTSLIEIEVKISKADFKKEFQTEKKESNRWKIYKHSNYAEPKKHLAAGYVIPNRFYFCVPAKLAQWAADFLKEKKSKYGLLSYDETRWTGNAHIVTITPAKNIHSERQERDILLLIARRTTNELITTRELLIAQDKELEALKRGVLEESEEQEQ